MFRIFIGLEFKAGIAIGQHRGILRHQKNFAARRINSFQWGKVVIMREDKQQKLDRVAKGILSIVVRFGFESLTPSRLARATGVSRPWVYKYIGGSKEDLSSFAVDHFGKLFAQLDGGAKPASVEFFQDDEIQRTLKTLQFAKEHPEIIMLYFRFKGTPSVMGKAIEKIEKEYRKGKEFQIQETFKISKTESKAFTDILKSFKMSLCHQLISGSKTAYTDEEYLATVRSVFEIFFKHLKNKTK